MMLGCFVFLGVGLIGWLVPKHVLVSCGWPMMIAIYLLQGNGRVVYESTNRAVFADFFPDTKAGAFAMFGVQSGLSGMIGFLVFTPFVNINPTLASEILVC